MLQSIGQLLNRQDLPALQLIELGNNWHKIVGKNLATKSMPIALKKKQLIVVTQHAAYSYHLKMMELAILQKIAQHFPFLRKSISSLFLQFDANYFSSTTLHPYHPLRQKVEREVKNRYLDIADERLRKYLQQKERKGPLTK